MIQGDSKMFYIQIGTLLLYRNEEQANVKIGKL